MASLRLAESDSDLNRCYPVMRQLRPHLAAAGFVARVRAMQREGYAIAMREDDTGAVRAVAGFRIFDMLACGRTLYVDDLVTDEAARSQGHGAALLRWLVERARAAGCHHFSLDSGTHRREAHRFYFRERMHVSSFHFALPLADPPA